MFTADDRAQLRLVVRQQTAIMRALATMIPQLDTLSELAIDQEMTMATVQEITTELVEKVGPLEDAVEASTTLLDSLGTRVTDLLQQIADQGLTPELEAQLRSVGDALSQGAGDLTAAVFRNTPADPGTPES